MLEPAGLGLLLGGEEEEEEEGQGGLQLSLSLSLFLSVSLSVHSCTHTQISSDALSADYSLFIKKKK